MTTEEKILKVMTEYIPSEATINDGCTIYHSTTQTHESFKQQLINANPEGIVYQYYLSRCAKWIKTLKLHNQILSPIFADNGTKD